MWKRWLSRLETGRSKPHPPREIAIAVLLLECARADFEHQPAEIDVVREALGRQFGMEPAALDELMGRAGETAREAVSLHGPVARLNAELSHGEKRGLMEWLWQVAAADGRVDPHEEALLRKLADLLYISHADYIRAKLVAQDGTQA